MRLISYPPIRSCVETMNHAIFLQLMIDGVDGSVIPVVRKHVEPKHK